MNLIFLSEIFYKFAIFFQKNYQVTDIQANDEINAVTAKIVDKLGLN